MAVRHKAVRALAIREIKKNTYLGWRSPSTAVQLLAANLGFFLTLCPGCLAPPAPSADVSTYTTTISSWQPSEIVEHFPLRIPSEAKGVAFSAFQGSLQGGRWVQVRFSLSPTEILKIYDTATATAKQYHDGGGSFTLVNGQVNGLPSTNFRTGPEQDPFFPDDYRVFVFDAQSTRDGAPTNWIHGMSYGVAVSKRRSEVVYWAEKW